MSWSAEYVTRHPVAASPRDRSRAGASAAREPPTEAFATAGAPAGRSLPGHGRAILSIVLDPAIDLLADEPLLLLTVVLAVGAVVGAFSIRGVSIGPAGALFAGLAASAL